MSARAMGTHGSEAQEAGPGGWQPRCLAVWELGKTRSPQNWGRGGGGAPRRGLVSAAGLAVGSEIKIKRESMPYVRTLLTIFGGTFGERQYVGAQGSILGERMGTQGMGYRCVLAIWVAFSEVL